MKRVKIDEPEFPNIEKMMHRTWPLVLLKGSPDKGSVGAVYQSDSGIRIKMALRIPGANKLL